MTPVRFVIPLATVLAMTGCFSGKSRSPSASSGAAKGSSGQTYYVNIFAPPQGGTISSGESPPRIDACGADHPGGCGTLNASRYYQTQYAWSEQVVLTATPAAGMAFIGWAGDCAGGDRTCTLSAGADKTAVAIFGPPGSGHTSFVDPTVHVPAFLARTMVCRTCHGEQLQGMSIAPGCGVCHDGTRARLPPPGGFVQPAVALSHPMPDWSSTRELQGAHAAAFAIDAASCRTCHGADLMGGNGYPACGGCHGVPSPPPVGLLLVPDSVSLDACGTQVFAATVTNATDGAVTWRVLEAGGGTVTGGTYVAPETAGTYHVVVASKADPSRTAQARITVGPEKVLSVSIVPGSGTVVPSGGTAAFTALVTTTCGTFVAN